MASETAQESRRFKRVTASSVSIPLLAPPSLAAGLCRSGSAEFCRIDGDIRLYFGELDVDLTIGPGLEPLERYLDAGDCTVIRIIDLRGNTPDRRIRKSRHPNQK